MASPRAAAGRRTQPTDDQVRGFLLAATLLLAAIEFPVVVMDYPGPAPGFSRLVTVDYFDIPLVVLVGIALPHLWRRMRTVRPRLGVATAMGLLATTALTLGFGPSWRGVALLLRLVGTVVVATMVASLDRDALWRWVGAPILVGAALTGSAALAQSLSGGATWIPGSPSYYEQVGNTVRAPGLSSHPYMLATYGLVAISIGMLTIRQARSRWWWLVLALAAMPASLSFSRATVMGLAVAGPAWLLAARRHRDLRRPLVAIVLGLAVPAALFLPAWLERVDDTATTDLNAATTLRIELIERSIQVMEDHPVVGVGPWGYVIDHGTDPDFRLPVHNIPLLIGAEEGIAVGVAAVVILILLGIAAFRAGPLAVALFGSVLGFTLFDVTLYWYPAGLVVLGVWLGALDRARDPGGPAARSSHRAPVTR